MKGIWKRLATLTLMAALVLCLLPMISTTAHAATYNDGVYVLEVNSFETYWDSDGSQSNTTEVVAITDVTISVDASNQIVCSFKVQYYDAIKQLRTSSYSYKFTVENKSCTEAISYEFVASYDTDDAFNQKAKGTLTRAARTEHTGGQNTCVAGAVCSICNIAYGEVDATAHSYGNWTYSNGQHSRTCALNGEHTDSGYCTRGEDGKCTVCGTTLVASLSGNPTTYYATADEAFAAAKAARSGTVTILADAAINGEWRLYDYSGISLVVNPNVTLTLQGSTPLYLDGSISGGGTIFANTSSPYLAVYSNGSISNVVIACRAESSGTIESGTFTYQGSAFSNKGIINGGTFNCAVKNRPGGKLEGGIFNGSVTNECVGVISGDTFNASLVNEYTAFPKSSGTINADKLTLGENFSFTENSGSYEGITCTTHQRYAAATCTAPATCIFCGHTGGEPDADAHSLNYTAENNVITETCANNCAGAATATLNINTDSVTYNGTAQTIETSVTHSETWRGDELTVQYENNTNVGTATVFIQIGEAKVTKTFTIEKADPTAEHFTFTPPENRTYDGQPKTATVAAATSFTGEGGIAVKYFAGDKALDGAPTDAGTYTVKIDVAGGTNFNPAENITAESWSFTIDKMEVEAPTIASKAYTGDAQTADVPTSTRYTVTTNEGGTKAGSYDVVLTLTDAANYKWADSEDATTTVTFKITPAENSWVTEPNVTNWTYGGAPNIPTADAKFGEVIVKYRLQSGTSADYTTTVPTNAGKYYVNFAVPTTENYLAISMIKELEIGQASLTLSVDDQTITYGKTIDNTKYTVTGLATGDTATVTLTPSTNNITKSGSITSEITIKNAAGEDVTACYTIATSAASLVINPDLSAIEGLTVGNVHYSDKSAIEELQTALNGATEDTATQTAINDAKVTCAQLLTQIDASVDALDTAEINATVETTASNVKLTDKAAVTKAIADIEKAKTDYAGNYTAEDIEILDAQIEQLKAALKAIENAETVIAALNDMPADVEPDDTKAIAAKKAYEKLTANEKTMVNSVAAAKVAALTNYKIVKGDKGTWKKGTLSFTINGEYGRFTGVKVNGKAISASYYTSKSGSTIVTLKESFFKQKSISSKATHKITFVFDDGTADGTFYIHKEAMTPATGDESNIVLYGAMFTMSLAALVALSLASKKRKQAK